MSGSNAASLVVAFALLLAFAYFTNGRMLAKRFAYMMAAKSMELSELNQSLVDVQSMHALARAEVAAMEGIKIDPSWPAKVKAEVKALRIAQLLRAYGLATQGLEASHHQLKVLYQCATHGSGYAGSIKDLEQLITHQDARAVAIQDQLNLWCDVATSTPAD